MKKKLLILGLSLFIGVQTLAIPSTIDNNTTIVAEKIDAKQTYDDSISLIVKFREEVIFTAMGSSVDVEDVTANLMSIPDEEFHQIVKLTAKMMEFTKSLKKQQSKMTASQRNRFNQELQFFEAWMDTLISIYPMRA